MPANAASRRAVGRDLAVEQVEHDGPAGRAGHGGVGQRRPQLGVGQHELLDRLEVGRQPPSAAGPAASATAAV